jgi:uncharacterized membrane protein
MKPDETIFKVKRKYVAVMLLCFLYGGFSLLLFLSQLYAVFWRSEIAGGMPFENGINDLNNDLNRFPEGRPGSPEGLLRFPRDPLAILTSPNLLTYLVSGVVAILAGMTIWSLIREKEIKSIKQATASNMLLPDEKAVVETLKKFDYELTQSKLVKETHLSKVQVHRAIKRLESKGVLEKHGYGLTNKIILKKEFFE